MIGNLEKLVSDFKLAIQSTTPGEWVSSRSGANSNVQAYVNLKIGGAAKVVLCGLKSSQWRNQIATANDAAFIALANPKNIKELIAALEQSQREQDTLTDQFAANLSKEHEKRVLAEKRIAELEKQYEDRVPTEWAYNQACKALQSHKDEMAKLRERIAGFERKEKHLERQSVIDSLANAGEPGWEIEEYMKKWDAERQTEALCDNKDHSTGKLCLKPVGHYGACNLSRPIMFIDGDISPADAEKLANVIKEWAEEDKPSQLSVKLSGAATDVLAERERQVNAEGWTPEHDDEHSSGEIALAASCYALYAHKKPIAPAFPFSWPWEPSCFKQSGARRDLVKAGALILAEIERIDRASGAVKGGE